MLAFILSFASIMPTNAEPVAKPTATVVSITPLTSVVRNPTYTPSRSRAYARGLLTVEQFKCLDKLWTAESKWNHKADNKTSSAYGIPQMLGMKTKNPYRQIQIGLRYIKHRYGTPCKAWVFWLRNHWY